MNALTIEIIQPICPAVIPADPFLHIALNLPAGADEATIVIYRNGQRMACVPVPWQDAALLVSAAIGLERGRR